MKSLKYIYIFIFFIIGFSCNDLAVREKLSYRNNYEDLSHLNISINSPSFPLLCMHREMEDHIIRVEINSKMEESVKEAKTNILNDLRSVLKTSNFDEKVSLLSVLIDKINQVYSIDLIDQNTFINTDLMTTLVDFADTMFFYVNSYSSGKTLDYQKLLKFIQILKDAKELFLSFTPEELEIFRSKHTEVTILEDGTEQRIVHTQASCFIGLIEEINRQAFSSSASLSFYLRFCMGGAFAEFVEDMIDVLTCLSEVVNSNKSLEDLESKKNAFCEKYSIIYNSEDFGYNHAIYRYLSREKIRQYIRSFKFNSTRKYNSKDNL